MAQAARTGGGTCCNGGELRLSPWTMVARCNAAFFSAARRIKEIMWHRNACTTEEQFWWAIKAMRACWNRDEEEYNKVTSAYPVVRNRWGPGGQSSILERHFEMLQTTAADERVVELRASKTPFEHHVTKRVHYPKRWAERWAAVRKILHVGRDDCWGAPNH